jgi:hypothetical protein
MKLSLFIIRRTKINFPMLFLNVRIDIRKLIIAPNRGSLTYFITKIQIRLIKN